MMKRILLLSLSIILLTGCSANYEFYFDKDTIKENISIVVDGDINRFKDLELDTIYIEDELINHDNPVLTDKSLYYKKNINVKNNKSYAVLNSEYGYDKFKNNYNLNECYENIFMEENNNYYYIYLNNLKCELLDPVNVSISSYYKIAYANGNNEKNNTYSWVLNGEKESDIELIILKEEYNVKTDKSSSINAFKIISYALILITGISLFIIHKKTLSN